MPAWVYTSSSPARRSARLTSTGRATGVMPYSESTTTTRPGGEAGVQQRGEHAVELGRGGRGPVAARAEALQVVVEVRQVDQQSGPAGPRRAPAGRRRRSRPSEAIPALGPQYEKSGKSPSAPTSRSCSAGGRV